MIVVDMRCYKVMVIDKQGHGDMFLVFSMSYNLKIKYTYSRKKEMNIWYRLKGSNDSQMFF